ncbi:MAG: tRNA uridine-5-carboxymethylaminomethyl(34) synthesis GTPase MnmE [Syntrophomonadaceae bacterium]|nr:tRNA uridine-5-carboxymethylaminomethyl(34) synthesis GTPase MnmE [Syntrophomonadaceae bacterium]
MDGYHDMIAAPATPPGESGIAIVRCSGSGVVETLAPIFRPHRSGEDIASLPGWQMRLGWLLDEDGGEVDEVIFAIMRGPRSYTGEDVAELHCHGGSTAVRQVLRLCLKRGMRLAEPGEFTRRAFLNGRMDLSQAEAVIDVIRARTERGLRYAVRQLSGQNRRYFDEIEDALLGLSAQVEAAIDFPDEVDEPDRAGLKQQLDGLAAVIQRLLTAAARSEIYREGARLVICGKPNVGKSSLLNALTRKDKAIVTPIPGTTRDVIEEYINLRGIPVMVADTAGIRETQDHIEQLGIARSRESLQNADIVLLVLDLGSGISEEDLAIYNQLDRARLIVLLNKDDLPQARISEAEIERRFSGVRVLRTSLVEERGLDELEDRMEELLLQHDNERERLELSFSLRQQEILTRCHRLLLDMGETINELSLELIAIDLALGLELLGELSGKTLKEDVLDRIFHDFCIGK